METVEVEKRGGVAWVWLNRPAKLNTFDATLVQELPLAIEELDDDEAVRVIVLGGRGRAFSAGFDMNWLVSLGAGADMSRLPSVTHIFDEIENAATPVIAAVQGPAAGLGLILAMVADIRLVSEQAAFSAPEVRLGLFTPTYLTRRLERLVGLGAAKQLALSGELIGAAEAARIGLANKIVPGDGLYAEAQALAEHLASLPSQAVQTTKAVFALADRGDYASWEREQMQLCWASPEREAAMISFLTRKK